MIDNFYHMSDEAGLLDRITGLLPQLTASGRKVADTILANPELAAQSSILELAERSETSTASINRLCRELGLRGYSELRLGLAREVGAQAGSDPDFDDTEELAPDLGARETLSVLAGSSINALRRTAALLDPAALDRLAAAIDDADRIQIAAQGGSAHIAAYLAAQLTGIGSWATANVDPTYTASQAVTLTDGDVALAISYSGAAGPVLDFVDIAAARGGLTAAITSSTNTPLARAVDVALSTTARSASLRYRGTAGRHAQLYVCDALYVRVAQRRSEQAERLLGLAGEVTQRYLVPPNRQPRSTR